MNNDIELKIKAANGRLKANYCNISIEKIGGRLWLRGIFPPKQNSNKSIHHQQRISIANANNEGVKIAEKTAKKISVQIDAKTFDWGDYIDIESKKDTIGEYIAMFEKDYFNKRARTFKTETTFKVEYLDVLKFLDKDEYPNILTFKNLIILHTMPDTRIRKRFCSTLQIFAKFCGVATDFSELAGNYSQSSRTPRKIPTDETIVEYYSQMPKTWRWVYGMMATYGLRNHEVFNIDLDSIAPDKGIKILDGKTGTRKCWPFHPGWFDLFCLQNPILPNINLSRPNRETGATVTRAFNRAGIIFSPYDLRHAWAVRTLEYNLDITLAAKMQGHGVDVHHRLYHTWINEKTFQSAFDKVVELYDS